MPVASNIGYRYPLSVVPVKGDHGDVHVLQVIHSDGTSLTVEDYRRVFEAITGRALEQREAATVLDWFAPEDREWMAAKPEMGQCRFCGRKGLRLRKTSWGMVLPRHTLPQHMQNAGGEWAGWPGDTDAYWCNGASTLPGDPSENPPFSGGGELQDG